MPKSDRSPLYRRVALAHYPPLCVWCGCAIEPVLEVAHLNCNRRDDSLENLVVLCPTHHRLLDLDLIPEAAVRLLRDNPRVANWGKLMGDAGARAAATRMARKTTRSDAAKKAVATRARRRAAGESAAPETL